MPIKLNDGIVLRSQPEQILKNKEDIAKHYEIDRALANLGIKVVGQVTTESELPDPVTYLGEYGDTYAVGDKDEVDAGVATYNYYVFTRPDINAGEDTSYWLNVGKISIVGPEGPQGPQGIQGPVGARGSKIFAQKTQPTVQDQGVQINDIWVKTDINDKATYGNMYQCVTGGGTFQYAGNILGPQGIQGPPGPQGPQGPTGSTGPQGHEGTPGGFIEIWGTLDNATSLPSPQSLDDPKAAYLVGVNKDLYVQIGETAATRTWNNLGPLNFGTLVTINGVGQSTWSADTKITKLTEPKTNRTYVYATKNGVITLYELGTTYTTQTIPIRGTQGHISVPTNTVSEYNCVNKAYVDAAIADATAGGGGGSTIYKHTFSNIPGINPDSLIIYSQSDTSMSTLTGFRSHQGKMIGCTTATDGYIVWAPAAFGVNIAFIASETYNYNPQTVSFDPSTVTNYTIETV